MSVEVRDSYDAVASLYAALFLNDLGSTSDETHGTPFDHKVITAYELFPATIAERMQDAGFTGIEIGTNPPPEGGRPFDQATVLATAPGSWCPSGHQELP